jgi:dynein heavy chain
MDSIFQSRQYEVYEKSNRKLEHTIKGINDYLERKRLQFPRFFFFSNEDLIFFLSREKEPTSLGPFLHKCFEGVAQLIIEEKNELKEIKGIVSNTGEVLEFVNAIQLEQKFDEVSTSRLLEEWLKDVEEEITITLQHQFELAMQKGEVKCVQQITQLVNQIK